MGGYCCCLLVFCILWVLIWWRMEIYCKNSDAYWLQMPHGSKMHWSIKSLLSIYLWVISPMLIKINTHRMPNTKKQQKFPNLSFSFSHITLYFWFATVGCISKLNSFPICTVYETLKSKSLHAVLKSNSNNNERWKKYK